jgi:uncharacterized protein YceH (UPF0502 family)
VLLLRGPQTPGELRGRAERMYRFEALDEVISTLQRLMQREPPLVKMLTRQPGTKEARFAQLLSREAETWETAPPASAAISGDSYRIAQLEQDVSNLRDEVGQLKAQFAEFKKQFD